MQLAKKLLEVQEEERKRLSRLLHDEFAQILSVAKFNLVWIRKELEKQIVGSSAEDLQERALETETLIDKLIISTGHITAKLRPIVLDQLGLIAALEWLVRDFESRLGIDCQFLIQEEVKHLHFDDVQSITIFRIVQELMTNIACHAGASCVTVDISNRDNHLFIGMHDNGRGITETEIANPHSFGISGIRERATFLGGTLEINGLPGEGTSILVKIPEDSY